MSSRILISTLFIISCFTAACSRYTENPEDTVVKLRDGIVDLVEGGASELTGSAAAGESFVLLSGYMTDPSDFNSLAVTPKLRERLAATSPHTEKYAIARVSDDSIEQYAYFEQGWPRDPSNRRMPLVIATCPMLIGGPEYRIRREYNSDGQVALRMGE